MGDNPVIKDQFSLFLFGFRDRNIHQHKNALAITVKAGKSDHESYTGSTSLNLMRLCGIALSPTEITMVGAIAYGVASDVIGASKLKDNSVVGFVMSRLGQALHQADTPKKTTRSRAKNPAPRRSPVRQSPSKRSSQDAPE